ncbi:hypothetical protein FEM48_Zijuj01G0103200 [Ziziphus jujuba var. spinosa]|uniref:EGF-like domain-containing protein n=1 Tax=Ziziphus jujuba var. spinosa TaxID=714518 RepID=A0A978W0P3_ZIZJJ|nr:hypothetical protein FEM48_Zijuj01G0103200 [Ziziphus jujuba var. spinosa]
MESNIPVINISLDGELSIMHYIARDCYDKQGKRNKIMSNATVIWVPPFSISSTKNKFVAIGCDTNAFVQANGAEERYATGCISFCNSTRSFNDSCSGSGCCETPIAGGLKNITVKVNSYYNHTTIWGFNPCSYAFVVEESKFKFSSSFFHQLEKIEKVPMVINWAIGDDESKRCHEAEKKANFTCKANSKCLNVNDGSGGYRCHCLRGYRGNPYHPEGCRDIDECEKSNPCYPGMCHNLPGNWKCTCPKGYKNSGTRCTKKDATDQSGRLLLYIVLGNAAAIAALSSQNPSVVIVANAVFGSAPDISNNVLSRAFQLDKGVISYLQSQI